MKLRGDDKFRARAYESAAASVEALGERFDVLVASGRLTDAPGIGAKLAGVITELHQTGTSPKLEELRDELPPGLLELSRAPGFTLTRLRTLYTQLGIRGVDDLRAALDSGRLGQVRGFGPQTQQKLADALERHLNAPKRRLLLEAMEAATVWSKALRAVPGVQQVDVAGAVRRWKETVGTLRFVVAAENPQAVQAALHQRRPAARVEGEEAGQVRLRLSSGLPAIIDIVAPERFALALLERTGSRGHVEQLQARAAAAGLPWSTLAAPTEAAIYARLGLPPIPPELRENEGELQAADAGDDFSDLVVVSDIAGLVHCHTTYSDGKNSVEQMARAAQAMGMAYISITDHSPTASYAGGLPVPRLHEQWAEIAAVQTQVDVRLLRGTESDILADGGLDYPDDILGQMDLVIASVHNRFKMDQEQMTRRLHRALTLPMFKIWGHALGRLVLRRDPIACRVEEILDAAAGAPAAVEINGDPHRLDLEPRWARQARRRGIPFVISTDAHSTSELGHVHFGVAMARRAGIRRGEVLNCLPVAQFLQRVRPFP